MATVELTRGGSKTYTINGDSDKAGTAQKIDFVCSYSTSGVLTIKMQIRPGSWDFSTNDAVAAVNYGGSKTYFKNHVSYSVGKNVTSVVGSTTRTMTSAGTYTVYYDLDMFSNGWGPTPNGGWYNKSFTVYIPGIIRSATVKIYINNSWKNGSIWIFNGTKWCPASDIHIYISGWKKSKLF